MKSSASVLDIPNGCCSRDGLYSPPDTHMHYIIRFAAKSILCRVVERTNFVLDCSAIAVQNYTPVATATRSSIAAAIVELYCHGAIKWSSSSFCELTQEGLLSVQSFKVPLTSPMQSVHEPYKGAGGRLLAAAELLALAHIRSGTRNHGASFFLHASTHMQPAE